MKSVVKELYKICCCFYVLCLRLIELLGLEKKPGFGGNFFKVFKGFQVLLYKEQSKHKIKTKLKPRKHMLYIIFHVICLMAFSEFITRSTNVQIWKASLKQSIGTIESISLIGQI